MHGRGGGAHEEPEAHVSDSRCSVEKCVTHPRDDRREPRGEHNPRKKRADESSARLVVVRALRRKSRQPHVRFPRRSDPTTGGAGRRRHFARREYVAVLRCALSSRSYSARSRHGYFPMQNLVKMTSRISSVTSSPVIAPSAIAASRSSMVQKSTGSPSRMTPRSRASALSAVRIASAWR